MTPSVRNEGKIEGRKVLVTGASGVVATPIVRALSVDNDVHALARLRTESEAQTLRDSGATPLAFDLATGSFDDIDDDFDLVLHFAVRRSADDDFEQEMVTGAEALGLLMQRCRRAPPSSIVPRPPSTGPRAIPRPGRGMPWAITTRPSFRPTASERSSPKGWPEVLPAPTASRR